MTAARLWGSLSAQLGDARTDLTMAASAQAFGAILATGDGGCSISGIRTENPFV